MINFTIFFMPNDKFVMVMYLKNKSDIKDIRII